MPRRATRKPERLPPMHGFARRLAALRELLLDNPPMAGDQAIKLLEEYLESLSRSYGYTDEGSLGRYGMFLRGHDALPDELLDRVEAYTQVRNCLAHSYGLQVSPALAEELLDFIALLLRQGAVTASQLMTGAVQSVAATDSLRYARDLMLRGGYGRLPVLDDGAIIGVLTEGDVVIAQAQAEHAGRRIDAISVQQALPADSAVRLATVRPDAPRDQVLDLLRQPGVIACLVTRDGSLRQRPLGIITHADLLYRL